VIIFFEAPNKNLLHKRKTIFDLVEIGYRGPEDTSKSPLIANKL
jgi:hypothetical protein